MKQIIIGLDFDNTIACYDAVFYRAAREQNLIPENVAETKSGVRDYLRSIGREDDWTKLQGYIYGARMDLASVYPGALEFIAWCVSEGIAVRIISHKTREPYMGPAYDLHAAAAQFLEDNGLFDRDRVGLPRENVFFEVTLQEKLARIAAENCSHFLDDLPELFSEDAFPGDTSQILFDPNHRDLEAGKYRKIHHWRDLRPILESAVKAAS